MSTDLHEDYRLELIYNNIKKFKILIFAILLALIIGAVSQSIWRSQKLEQANHASAIFNEYTKATLASKGKSNNQNTPNEPTLRQIYAPHNPIAYQLYGRLISAAEQVSNKKYQEAIYDYQWILKQKKIDPGLKQISALRIARIYLELNQPDKVVPLLTQKIYAPDFDAGRLALLGQAYAKLSDNLKARKSYEQAFELTNDEKMQAMITDLRHNLLVKSSSADTTAKTKHITSKAKNKPAMSPKPDEKT